MMETGASQSSNEKLVEYCKELRKSRPLNSKILFINCPQFNFDTFEVEVAKNKGYYAYPPTGLQCLTSALSGRGLDIDILDLNYELLKRVNSDSSFDYKSWLSILDEYLEEHNPSVVGISNFFSVDTPYFIQVSNFLRKKTNCIILAGGQNATYNARKFLEKNLCDFVCERESENKINFLFDNLYGNQGHKATPGIFFKYKGKIERTEGKRDIVELKGNLIDAHKLIHVEKYCQAGSLSPYSRMAGKDTPFAGILLNRGCRGGCKFCDVVDYMGKGVRSRKVKDFLDEITYLYNERGIRYFELLDDDFTVYKDRALEVLSGIIERGLKINWASNNGLIASTLDEELMKKMRDSGCIGFHIGVESGNPEKLREIGKPGTLETFRKFSRIAQKFPEMFIVDNYIFGLPGETFKQMLGSFYFSLEMGLDWSSYTVYQPNVSFFGLGKERGSKTAEDFIPAKDVLKGKLTSSKKVFTGPDIFNIPKGTIPSKEQVNQIWFTFNLIRNFIRNKNLMPGGKSEKFISWIEVIQERYPTHPYINMFLSLAYLLVDNREGAEIQHKKTKENLKDKYWKQKFDQFGLTEIVNNFPKNSRGAGETLRFLRRKYER